MAAIAQSSNKGPVLVGRVGMGIFFFSLTNTHFTFSKSNSSVRMLFHPPCVFGP